MIFSKPLRARAASGEITCSVRIWQRPRVKVGGRYTLGSGAIVMTSVREIVLDLVANRLAVHRATLTP